MSTILNFARDVQGYNTFSPPVSKDKFSATLPPDANATVTVPSNSVNWVVSFSFQPGSNVWVAYNGNAVVPVGATFASSNSELLPGSRYLTAGTTINFVNNGTSDADIGVIMYAISQ